MTAAATKSLASTSNTKTTVQTAAVTILKSTVTSTAATTKPTSTGDFKVSAYNRMQRQPGNVVRTMCSCIETPKACPVKSATTSKSTASSAPMSSAPMSSAAMSSAPVSTTSVSSTSVSSTSSATPSPTCQLDCDLPTISGNSGSGTFDRKEEGCGELANGWSAADTALWDYSYSDCYSIQRCADFAASHNGAAFQLYNSPSDGNWHCEYATGTFSGTYEATFGISQYYQYNSE